MLVPLVFELGNKYGSNFYNGVEIREDSEDDGGYVYWIELTKKIIVQNGWNIKNMGYKAELISHYIKHMEENSTSLVEVQCLQQSDGNCNAWWRC